MMQFISSTPSELLAEGRCQVHAVPAQLLNYLEKDDGSCHHSPFIHIIVFFLNTRVRTPLCIEMRNLIIDINGKEEHNRFSFALFPCTNFFSVIMRWYVTCLLISTPMASMFDIMRQTGPFHILGVPPGIVVASVSRTFSIISILAVA